MVLEALKEGSNALNTSVLPKGVKVDAVLRPHLADRHDAPHRLQEPGRGRDAGRRSCCCLFLGNLRAAAIVALMIPLSLLATFIGLTWRGIPANLLSLGAMDFGIIVDGAVIVVENVFRRSERAHEPRRQGGAFADDHWTPTAEVGRPTFFSMLIIIAAHIPIFTLQRHEGRIFAPMAWTVTSALIGSLLFSLTLVPLLCYFLLRRRLPHEENTWFARRKRVYEPIAAAGR